MPATTTERTGQRESITWSRDHYALIGQAGTGREHDRLALCMAHQPRHIRYVDWRDSDAGWCVDLGRERRG